jgi:hypothetical protein
MSPKGVALELEAEEVTQVFSVDISGDACVDRAYLVSPLSYIFVTG